MATTQAELGSFARETGPPSVWAAAGATLGLACLAVAAGAIVLDLADAATFDARPVGAILAGATVIASIVGLYQSSVIGRRGRSLATLGLVSAAIGGVAAFVHGAVVAGTLQLDEFGLAYFNREVLSAIWKDLLRAAINTIKYATLGEGFGIILGLIIATFAVSKRRWLRIPAIAYVDVIRGLPLLMLLLLIYFGPTFIGITLPSVTAGIIGLTINSSAYVAEIFRAGIQSIDRGQMDAARSLGMPYPTAMLFVVIPQAVRRVIPPLTNEFIALIKDTSLLLILGATVGTRELLTAARQSASATFSPTPYMAASIIYLAMTLPLIRVVTWLERRVTGTQALPIRIRLLRRSVRAG
ncbi:MAG: amino acid ABC transporter permease [Actinomycetota bacterium]